MDEKFKALKNAEDLSILSGRAFEEYLEQLFADLNYKSVRTPMSGDYGADLILRCPDDKMIVVQAKQYASSVGFDAVKEVFFAKEYYKADEAWVVCTGDFTKQAVRAAAESDVKLVDKTGLEELMCSRQEQGNRLVEPQNLKEVETRKNLISLRQWEVDEPSRGIVPALFRELRSFSDDVLLLCNACITWPVGDVLGAYRKEEMYTLSFDDDGNCSGEYEKYDASHFDHWLDYVKSLEAKYACFKGAERALEYFLLLYSRDTRTIYRGEFTCSPGKFQDLDDEMHKWYDQMEDVVFGIHPNDLSALKQDEMDLFEISVRTKLMKFLEEVNLAYDKLLLREKQAEYDDVIAPLKARYESAKQSSARSLTKFGRKRHEQEMMRVSSEIGELNRSWLEVNGLCLYKPS